MNIFDEQMIKGLGEIRQLQEVTYLAVHRVADRDGSEYDRVSVVAEDVTGRKVEIHYPTASALTSDIGKGYSRVAEVLTHLLVRRVCNGQNADVEPAFAEYLPTGDINALIQMGRTVAPYTGKTWINEDRARLYEHEEPEYLY